jgi:SAM-dependent methyltransferase
MNFREVHPGTLLTPGNFKDVLAPLSGRNLGRVLDVGCNTTWFAQFADDYHGIDVDERLVRNSRAFWVARERWSLGEAESRIRLLEPGASGALPYEEGSFDTVILRDVIEHVEDGFGLFREVGRVLKSNGLVYLSCPDSQSHVWDEPTHRRPYPIRAQDYMGRAMGFESVYRGYESVVRGTQPIARLCGGRTPALIRVFWNLPFWPRNAVTVHRKI